MIDVLKFGFVKVREFEEGMPQSALDGFWHKIIDDSHFVELVVLANIFTISYNRTDKNGDTHKMKIASRYKCDTQEQFDFLILNGRVGNYFKMNKVY